MRILNNQSNNECKTCTEIKLILIEKMSRMSNILSNILKIFCGRNALQTLLAHFLDTMSDLSKNGIKLEIKINDERV